MAFPLLIGLVMSILVVGVGGFLGFIGFLVEAPHEFAAELHPPPVLHPSRPSVTELCRHEIPDLHGKEGRVLIVEFPPGVHDGRHLHPGALFAHVLQGTVISEADGAPIERHGPGDTWFGPPMQRLAQVGNDGWDTAKVLLFDLTERGQPLQFLEPGEESKSALQSTTQVQAEASLATSGHVIGGSR